MADHKLKIALENNEALIFKAHRKRRAIISEVQDTEIIPNKTLHYLGIALKSYLHSYQKS